MLNLKAQNNRPYFYYNFDQLFEVAENNWSDIDELSVLNAELNHRNRPLSLDLRNQVINRLKELESFKYPTTEISGLGQMKIIDRNQKGLLMAVGYETGQKSINNGITQKIRRETLISLYVKEIPKDNEIKDLHKWGKPFTGTRLKQIVYSLAHLAKQEKANPIGDYRLSISHRESDLKFLRKKFYDGNYDFIYPKT